MMLYQGMDELTYTLKAR